MGDLVIFSRRAARRMVNGELTVAFQPEKDRPRAKKGHHYPIQPRSMGTSKRPDASIGRFRVKSVRLVSFSEIPQEDAHDAGFSGRAELREYLERRLDGRFEDSTLFWRVEFEIIQVEDRRAA